MAEFIRVPKTPDQEGKPTVRQEHFRESLAQKIVMCNLIGNFNPDHPNLDDVWRWLETKGMLKENGRPNREAFANMIGVRFLTISAQVRIMIDTLDLLTQLSNLGKFNMADLGLDYALDSFLRAQERMQETQALQAHPAEVSTDILAQAEAFFAPATIDPIEVEIATLQNNQSEQPEQPKLEVKPKTTRAKTKA